MRRWLQEFSFKKSAYERPNQKWVCGRACSGPACLAGPDAAGQCGATAECRPLRKGDRWHCTRPGLQGGSCPAGPGPDGACGRPLARCVPARSLRSWRGLAVLGAVGASLACVFLWFASERGTDMLSPGPLSFGHASVQANCAACHEGLKNPPATWLTAGASHSSPHANSDLCLRCHHVGAAPLQPHSLPAKLLAQRTAEAHKNAASRQAPASLWFTSLLVGSGHSSEQPLACATCHQEHRGPAHDLKQLTNRQCQSCHAAPFHSLADGHPPFSEYPFERRTRLIFDHDSHLGKHFAETSVAGSAPRSCLDCHEADLKGGVMVLKSFAATCASCHGDQIKGKGAVSAGLAFLRLPRLDDRTLTGPYGIGEWPEDADQPLTPVMKLLLSADPELRAALDALEGSDLSSLPVTNVVKLRAAQQIAWGIKGLIFDLGTQGQGELLRRLGSALGRGAADRETEAAVAFLGADLVRATFQSAFPKLQTEVANYREKKAVADTELTPSPPISKPGPVKFATPDASVSHGGWYSPEASFTLYYRPSGHSDGVLTAWLNLAADAENSLRPAAAQAWFRELSDPKAAGYCAKCHSTDATSARLVNWKGATPDPAMHSFTRFSHSAHMSLVSDQGCLSCHTLKPASAGGTYASAFGPGLHDPARFQSNFLPISQQTCVTCHQPRSVRADCLLCHNYHVGQFEVMAPRTAILPRATVP